MRQKLYGTFAKKSYKNASTTFSGYICLSAPLPLVRMREPLMNRINFVCTYSPKSENDSPEK
jgi:hypothetical protein